MAHFAKLDDNNVVLEVLVVDNETLDSLPYPQSESKGIVFLANWSGGYTNWKQTSYNASFRKNFAGINYTYDSSIDAFVSPKPYSSWLLNTNTAQWQAPVPYPNDGKYYRWNEETQSWVEITGA